MDSYLSQRWSRPRRRPMRLEQLESRRVLAGQVATGMALEHVYQSDPGLFPEWNEYLTAAQGDLDGDEQLDLVVFFQSNNQAPQTLLFQGQGDGTYVPSPLPNSLPTGNWMLADVEGDGDQDLLSVSQGELLVSLNAGRSDGVWQGLQPVTRQSLLSEAEITTFTAADFNRDGDVDLVLATSEAVYVRPGVGDGNFEPGIQYPLRNGSQALVAGDLDGDGDLDFDQRQDSNRRANPFHRAWIS